MAARFAARLAPLLLLVALAAGCGVENVGTPQSYPTQSPCLRPESHAIPAIRVPAVVDAFRTHGLKLVNVSGHASDEGASTLALRSDTKAVLLVLVVDTPGVAKCLAKQLATKTVHTFVARSVTALLTSDSPTVDAETKAALADLRRGG